MRLGLSLLVLTPPELFLQSLHQRVHFSAIKRLACCRLVRGANLHLESVAEVLNLGTLVNDGKFEISALVFEFIHEFVALGNFLLLLAHYLNQEVLIRALTVQMIPTRCVLWHLYIVDGTAPALFRKLETRHRVRALSLRENLGPDGLINIHFDAFNHLAKRMKLLNDDSTLIFEQGRGGSLTFRVF